MFFLKSKHFAETIIKFLQNLPYRIFKSAVFNCGQKMALRAIYFIRALTKALTYYYTNRPQRPLLAAIGNN